MPEHPTTVQDHYKQTYFAAIDLIVAAINKWFQQKEFNMFQKLGNVLTGKLQCEEEKVVNFYATDIVILNAFLLGWPFFAAVVKRT